MLALVLALGGCGASIVAVLRDAETMKAAFCVVEQMFKLERAFQVKTARVRASTLAAGYTNNTYWYNKAVATLDEQIELIDEFCEFFEAKKRKHVGLRRANNAYEGYVGGLQLQVEHSQLALEFTMDMIPDDETVSFDEYLRRMTSLGPRGKRVYEQTTQDSDRFTRRLRWVSMNANVEVRRLVVTFLALLMVTVAALAVALVKVAGMAKARIVAQDQLARQQAHEMRNKFAPAMYCMEHFIEACECDDSTVDDFRLQCDDMSMALVALKEVEAQHQARLDIYKILRHNYVANLETFDIIGFLNERVDVERAIAFARRRGTNASNVDFNVKIRDAAYADCDEIHVRTDHYVLKHVVANCLSNSRKFTHSGEVVLTFCGATDDGLLVFSVRDTGTGLPPKVVDTLFRQGVATGATSGRDVRGTGLGLPSCDLFCKTAGGYIKLKGTRQQDEKGQNGYTDFEFAVRGDLVRADRRGKPLPPPLESAVDVGTIVPDDVVVVVVDDSALNRMCVVRSLTKVQEQTEAAGWTFAQFETIEAAQPCLRDIHAANKPAIVCLDVRSFPAFAAHAAQEQMGSRGGVLTGIQVFLGSHSSHHSSHAGDPMAHPRPRLSRYHRQHQRRPGRGANAPRPWRPMQLG